MFLIKKIILISFMVLITIVFITGCETAGKRPKSTNQSPSFTDEIYEPQQGLTPKQRFSKALDYLEHGQVGQASAELKAYLKVIPKSKRAKDLLQQTVMNSDTYYPAKHFTVKLTSGESLSTLARTYLGSALKFYALARYNNISNPSRVNIGQSINIPLTALAIEKRSELAQLKNTKITKPLITDKTTAGKRATQKRNPPISSTKHKTAKKKLSIPKLNAEQLLSKIEALVSGKKYSLAIDKIAQLEKLTQLPKAGRQLALIAYKGKGEALISTNKIKAASYFSKAGRLNIQDGNAQAAFNNFEKVTELDPENAMAMEEMLILQKDLSDKLHREASTAYRNQNLDVAINKWTRVLEINPEHDNAKLYRSQAIELKAKLEKLKNND